MIRRVRSLRRTRLWLWRLRQARLGYVRRGWRMAVPEMYQRY